MSDTPLADALKDYYCFSHLDWYYLCCEVERENAKLHAEVKVTRKNYETCKRENAALNHALNIAQTELRLNGCAKAADEVAKLHDAARKEAQQSVTK